MENGNAMMIAKGAEAEIHVDHWMGRDVVRKKRIPKPYREPVLDAMIRQTRTNLEAKVLGDAKRAGVPVPVVYEVDHDDTSILMEFLNGRNVRELIAEMAPENIFRMFDQVGENTGNLHAAGIAHGDLTTANMILCDDSKILFLDFSLSELNASLEQRGVDLLLLDRVLRSTHYANSGIGFKAFLKGYARATGASETQQVAAKMKEIARRGRYVERKPDLLRH